jgi:hypothetical protein
METIGQITTVIVILVLSVTFAVACVVNISSYFKKKKLPKLAGTAVPEIGQGFDISKRYDIDYSGGDYNSQFVEHLKGVLIIGYVGEEDDESVGKMYMRSRWLVVGFADGRKAYLMPRAILSLEESGSV